MATQELKVIIKDGKLYLTDGINLYDFPNIVGGVGGGRGRTGAQGQQGAQGSQGASGGPQGNQGSQGTQGSQGSQGTQGTQGSQGTQGVQGSQGATGGYNVYGQFIRTSNQTINVDPNPNATLISFDTIDLFNDVTLIAPTPSTQIQVNQSGVYQFSLEVQLTQDVGSPTRVFFWLIKNGTPIANSGSDTYTQGSNKTSVPYLTFDVTCTAGDIIQFAVWGTDDAPYLIYVPIQTATGTNPKIPAAPSAVAMIKKIGN